MRSRTLPPLSPGLSAWATATTSLGIVPAVAFLIAGIALGAKSAAKTQPKPTAGQKTITTPKTKRTASGTGQAVGRLVLVRPDGKPAQP